MNGGLNLDEPTLGEKLASLDRQNDDKGKSTACQEAPVTSKLPSADSVHLLLKQALHADDHALLLDSLYTRDEKVITKSISLLNPADVLKLLNALISVMQSRGAVLSCAIPWLKALLNQHASSIVSQESSLNTLNSLFQLVESRISTYKSALDLSFCLDYLYAGIPDDDDESTVPVLVYEDQDSEDSEDAMDTDEDSEVVGVVIDSIVSDGSELVSG